MKSKEKQEVSQTAKSGRMKENSDSLLKILAWYVAEKETMRP